MTTIMGIPWSQHWLQKKCLKLCNLPLAKRVPNYQFLDLKMDRFGSKAESGAYSESALTNGCEHEEDKNPDHSTLIAPTSLSSGSAGRSIQCSPCRWTLPSCSGGGSDNTLDLGQAVR
jgi:hypothetical protein